MIGSRKMNDAKCVSHAALAESVPRGEHRVLENAGHSTIHTDRPDAVVQAIRDLLNRVGGKGGQRRRESNGGQMEPNHDQYPGTAAGLARDIASPDASLTARGPGS